MLDKLPTHLLVSAQIRAAATQGVNMTVLRKGDPVNGALLLKIRLLNGTAELLSQIWQDDERVWTSHGDPVPERTADELAEEQASYDPDIWIVEVEDRQGRLWFPGKVIENQ